MPRKPLGSGAGFEYLRQARTKVADMVSQSMHPLSGWGYFEVCISLLMNGMTVSFCSIPKLLLMRVLALAVQHGKYDRVIWLTRETSEMYHVTYVYISIC